MIVDALKGYSISFLLSDGMMGWWGFSQDTSRMDTWSASEAEKMVRPSNRADGVIGGPPCRATQTELSAIGEVEPMFPVLQLR